MVVDRGRIRGLAIWILFFLLCLATAATALAQEVRHTVRYPGDREQTFLVHSEFPVSTPVTELIMPNWTPGSYLMREYAANVNRVSVASAGGRELQAQKIAKDRWRVETDGVDGLVVDYEVHTPDLKVQSSWASKAFSLINGASVFLYTEQSRDLPQSLNIEAGAERGWVFTALPREAGDGTYRAKNYDQLVDSPVAVARAPSYRFSRGGQDYVLVNVGENASWDGAQAAVDVEKIVAETQSFWRTNPLEGTYWFLNFAVQGRGGLEHDHSTVIMTGRRQMRNRADYIKWLGVVAHEFFHVWNVRNMRPAALAEYDYQNEQYTRQLWLAEGVTSYYDNLLMSRARLISPSEYLELLAADIHRLELTPGRLLHPVTEASFDAWIRHYRPNANTVNSTISYYTKGAVIGFVLDTHLREKSKSRRSLDDVMRRMYELYSNTPYGSDAFRKVLVEFGGADAGLLLDHLLTTTNDPDVDGALGWYGLRLVRGAGDAGADTEEEQPLPSGFGVIWEDNGLELLVKTVRRGSGGSLAGLLPGDELLAIGDERVNANNFQALMTSFKPGEQTTLLVSRRGKVLRLDVTLDSAAPERYDIEPIPGFGKRHVRRLQSLLGQELDSRL